MAAIKHHLSLIDIPLHTCLHTSILGHYKGVGKIIGKNQTTSQVNLLEATIRILFFIIRSDTLIS